MEKSGVLDLIEKQGGITLDIGCGGNKQPGGYVGIDYRPLPGVDIVHDLMLFPWPLPDECVVRAVSSHLLEHLPPFSTDPKLIALIRLLINNGVVREEAVRSVMGEWDLSTPGFIRFMDEAWRVLKTGAQFLMSVPHALSSGFPQDPTHINMINEITFSYFDPFDPKTNGLLWSIYRPKPWAINYIAFDPGSNIEVILTKRSLEEVQNGE